MNQSQEKSKQMKTDDLEEDKAQIQDESESEIVKRYFYQEGKTRQMLKNELEVVEAINLLMDQEKYNSILQEYVIDPVY